MMQRIAVLAHLCPRLLLRNLLLPLHSRRPQNGPARTKLAHILLLNVALMEVNALTPVTVLWVLYITIQNVLFCLNALVTTTVSRISQKKFGIARMIIARRVFVYPGEPFATSVNALHCIAVPTGKRLRLKESVVLDV